MAPSQHRPNSMPKNQPAPPPTMQYQQQGGPASLQPTASHHQPQQIGLKHQLPAPNLRADNQLQLQQQVRLTLPLRDSLLLGPFKLEHGVQFSSRTFHLRPQLFEALSKSMMQQQQQTGAVIQELQFRAYLSDVAAAGSKPGDSLLAQNNRNAATTALATNSCQWPELFQLSCNQQIVHLDRSSLGGGGLNRAATTTLAHKAADIFPYCQVGDNLLEFQVNDCYCSHEFVLELVDRPTLKAFMNSCFKSRLLSSASCLSRLRTNFGSQGFLCRLPEAAIFNEYVSEYLQQANGQQVEQSRVKISLRCPLAALNGNVIASGAGSRRIRTPARGPNCKHLQCFDLENFLFANRDKTRWLCPICLLPVPFNMLELDQHQMGIVQSMANVTTTDEVLIDPLGHWQSFHGPTVAAPSVAAYAHGTKSNGTFHPQAPTGGGQATMLRPTSGGGGTGRVGQPGMNSTPPAGLHWDAQQSVSPPSSSARRPTSALSQPTRRPASSSAPPAKRNYTGPQYGASQAKQTAPNPAGSLSNGQPNFSGATSGGNPETSTDELSPLAAMERTIIHHEQQMGPPPFDANILTASPLKGAATSTATPPATITSAISNNPQQSPPLAAISSNAPASTNANFASPYHQPSPVEAPANSLGANYQQTISSPVRQVPASPAARQLPQSPMQQQQPSISKPATPLVIQGAPETPATPSNSVQQQQQQQQSAPSLNGANNVPNHTVVDHQPLSNGSASAASIGSSSTMTPGGQSLGSVGMGGDSRCNTAPLQNSLGSLDDLVVVATGSSASNSQHLNLSSSSSSTFGKQQLGQQSQLNQQQQLQQHQSMNSSTSGLFSDQDKSEILMSKLMMDSDRERASNDLALALEEAEWKQQLDRGKSEHLANFLNEPLMKKRPLMDHHQHHHLNADSRQHQQLYQQQQQQLQSNELEGANRMLSGGLNPSDDELHSPHNQGVADELQPNYQHQQHTGQSTSIQLDSYASYLDSNSVEDGAGLPPDDSILDLFER